MQGRIAVIILLILLIACTDRVLIVGGSDNLGNFLNTAEIYNPNSGKFIPTQQSMGSSRLAASATNLGNRILIAGGQSPAALQNAETYQIFNDSFMPTGNMNHIHVAHTATYLNPAVVSGPAAGMVLIAGGDQFSLQGSAELYNKLAGIFVNTNPMTTPRTQHTAVLISHCGCPADGKVLIVGGYDNKSKVLNSAEIFDPLTQKFTATGSMAKPRFRHTATLLDDGRVLITGGMYQFSSQDNINPVLNTAEIYDPKTGNFRPSKSNMSAYRAGHAASLLNDGTVLLTGGQDNHFIIENTAEIFDPRNNKFTATASTCAGSPPPPGCMQFGRDFHISETLANGKVLIAGGVNSNFVTIAAAEIYDPASKTFTPTSFMSAARSGAASSKILSE